MKERERSKFLNIYIEAVISFNHFMAFNITLNAFHSSIFIFLPLNKRRVSKSTVRFML